MEERRAKKQVTIMEVSTDEAIGMSEASDHSLLTLESFKAFIRRNADLLETLELSKGV